MKKCSDFNRLQLTNLRVLMRQRAPSHTPCMLKVVVFNIKNTVLRIENHGMQQKHLNHYEIKFYRFLVAEKTFCSLFKTT